MTPICEGIFQIWQLGMELWNKMFSFEDNIVLWHYSKQSSWENDPYLWRNIFKSDNLEQSYGTKTFNFEDNIALLVLKMIVLKKKQPLFVKEFFNSDHLEQSYDTKNSVVKITIG